MSQTPYISFDLLVQNADSIAELITERVECLPQNYENRGMIRVEQFSKRQRAETSSMAARS